jgi:hypothetical protein
MWWVVNATPRPLYPRERPSTYCIGGCVCPKTGLDGSGKSRATGIRSPDCRTLSESLYRLCYPGPQIKYINVSSTKWLDVIGYRLIVYCVLCADYVWYTE